jgi:thiol-disulfide isomerase/thioredoxin
MHFLRNYTLLLAALAVLSAQKPERHPAPPFQARTIDGQSFTRNSLKGKPVLIQFWATWCGYCRKEEPAVENIVKAFESKGLVVLAVNIDEPREKVARYLAEHKRSPKIVLSQDTNLGMFHSGSFPTYLLIDQQGRLTAYQRGAGGEQSLRDMVEQVGLKQ